MFPKLPFPFNLFLGFAFFLGTIVFFFYINGWYELAEFYKTSLKLSDDGIIQKSKTYRCRISKDLAGSSFSTVAIAFLDTGLYLNSGFDSFPILNTLIPSLLIPWQEINKYEVVRSNKHCFYLGNPTITILVLSANQVRELETLSSIKISDYFDRD